MRFVVNTYVTEAGFDRMAGRSFDRPYAGTPLGFVRTLVVEAPDSEKAAEEAWRIGNREGADVLGVTWPPEVRSMMTGDVVSVETGDGTAWYDVCGMGWGALTADEVGRVVDPDAIAYATARSPRPHG